MNTQGLSRLDGGKLRALIVDDEESITQLVSMALRYEGWDVRTASTGEEALAHINEWEPDVAVFDVLLPDFDRAELAGEREAGLWAAPEDFVAEDDAVTPGEARRDEARNGVQQEKEQR